MRTRPLTLIVALLAPWTLAAQDRETTVFAVVVGVNASLDRAVQPLRYADDDAARFHELFRLVSPKVSLFTILDEESRLAYPHLKEEARIPYSKDILDQIGAYLAEAASLEAQGHPTAFFLVYSGHGGLGPGQEGYINLQDRPFTRSDLYHSLISVSRAHRTHIIVDACNSYFLVRKKSTLPDEEEAQRAIARFLAAEDLDRYPGTGVLLSTASALDSHEWSALQGGVFSHEVRSAMAGAADVNSNGTITYGEVLAFLSAANQRISHAQARPQVFAHPPLNDKASALIDLNTATNATTLSVDRAVTGRFFLETEQGSPVAQFHKSAEQPVSLLLPAGRAYFLRGPAGEARLHARPGGIQKASALAYQPPRSSARGSVATALGQGLFATPFGRAFYDGYMAHPEASAIQPVIPAPTKSHALTTSALVTLGAAVASGIAAGVCGMVSSSKASSYREAFESKGLLQEDLRQASESYALGANILFATALASGVASLVMLLIDSFGPSSAPLSLVDQR